MSDITKSSLIKEIMDLPLIKEIKTSFPQEESEIDSLIVAIVSSGTEGSKPDSQSISSNEQIEN